MHYLAPSFCWGVALSYTWGIGAILQMARGPQVNFRTGKIHWHVKTVTPDLKPDDPGGTVISNGLSLTRALFDLVIPTSWKSMDRTREPLWKSKMLAVWMQFALFTAVYLCLLMYVLVPSNLSHAVPTKLSFYKYVLS